MRLAFNIYKSIEPNKIPLLIFFGSLFIFIGFANTRLVLTDEAVILNQFYNLIHGSISLETFKIKSAAGPYLLYGDDVYGRFSYSLLFLSMPIYYFLRGIDLIYGAHLFMLFLWSLSGGIIIYIIAKIRELKCAKITGIISFYILFAGNIYFLDPIYFSKWGELLSIEFTNIMISSIIILLVYILFRKIFGNRIAIFASIFILTTPISFYAITLKHHSLSLLLTIMTFFSLYKYHETKENNFIYSAYILVALGIWTRILDGIVLMATLIFTDFAIFNSPKQILQRSRHIFSILIITIIFLIPFFSFNYMIFGNPFSITEKVSGEGKPVMLNPGIEPIIFENYREPKSANILLESLGYTETRVNLGIIIKKGYGTIEIFKNNSGAWTSLGKTTNFRTYTMTKGSQIKIVATPMTGYYFDKYVNNVGTIIVTNPKIAYQKWNTGLDIYFNSTTPGLELIQSSRTVIKGDSWQNSWQDILNAMFIKFGNTFGIFLVSPFLIISIVFILDVLRQKIKINILDKIFGLYAVLLLYLYKDFLIPAIIDSPMLIDNRYLLIIYIVLLYFVIRMDMIRKLIEDKLKTIFLLYGIFLIMILSYFIKGFPIPFIDIYYSITLITLFLLLILSIAILIHRCTVIDNLIVLLIAFSIALTSSFLIFYYWIINMTYIFPTQDYNILPILDNILRYIEKTVY